MNSKKISDSQKVISIVLTAATIVIIFFGVLFLSQFIEDYKYDCGLQYRESTIEYNVEYPVRFMEMTLTDRMHAPNRKNLQEYYALAEYMNCQVQADINGALGKEDMVTYWTGKRDEAKSDCGSLTENAEEFSEKLENGR